MLRYDAKFSASMQLEKNRQGQILPTEFLQE